MKRWYQAVTVLLLLYVIIGGFLMPVPRLPIVNESIRNLYFHVPMWFGMTLLLAVSAYYSVQYLRKGTESLDDHAVESVNTAVLYGLLGLSTGAIWANYTWGAPWNGDPQQTMAAIGVLIYIAYLVLRGAINDPLRRARVSAIYNLYAFAVFIPLIFVLPRYTDSLHPGKGGNPAFSQYDLDNTMRLVFYPAVIGWSMLAWWITKIAVRLRQLKRKKEEIQAHRQIQIEENL
ncbi:heme exporter protein C [Thermonema lapsum]|uniref:Heme exporter protein C n=1 Tax=Thermonema lapsum TaxID=28195 RepID=A0A846MRY8_9BACT|nr:cytochrome c biogenesis protein CcsA [Thermonema lapsum]NIK74027.1 heme exporter protein C [Thermonema lapsum]